MGRHGYPSEFRRRVLDLVEAGRPVAEVAKDLGISGQSIYAWRHRDRIDRGLEPGLSSPEKAELVAVRRRIAGAGKAGDPEALRRAVEGDEAPKRRFEVVAMMVKEGCSVQTARLERG